MHTLKTTRSESPSLTESIPFFSLGAATFPTLNLLQVAVAVVVEAEKAATRNNGVLFLYIKTNIQYQ